MSFYEEFARKFFAESRKDLGRAKKAFSSHDYSDAVFHSQQCVEKAVKAMIEAKREYVCNHGPTLASIFVRVFEDEWEEAFDELVDVIGWFTEYYTRSRYPFFLRGKVIAPDEFIDRETASEAIEKAYRVLRVAERYLREKRII